MGSQQLWLEPAPHTQHHAAAEALWPQPWEMGAYPVSDPGSGPHRPSSGWLVLRVWLFLCFLGLEGHCRPREPASQKAGRVFAWLSFPVTLPQGHSVLQKLPACPSVS